MCVVQPTNSWFTSSKYNGVQIMVDVGELKLKVFQNDASVKENEILTNSKNTEFETDENPNGTPNTETSPSYVNLTGKIIPGEWVDLVLILLRLDQNQSATTLSP